MGDEARDGRAVNLEEPRHLGGGFSAGRDSFDDFVLLLGGNPRLSAGNQSYRASGLNLAVAAIILWNTVYLGRAVDELRSRGETVPDELVAHIAPLGWEHITFNGDYVWPAQPLGTAFRPLRNPRADFLEAP